MMRLFFDGISALNSFYWMYLGWFILLAAGLFLTFKSRAYQFFIIANIVKATKSIIEASRKESSGVSPFRLFFASVGGTIGIGNIAAVTTAILIGGPGALFWLWIAAIAGMIIKYVDVYLSIQYRQANSNNSYDGGPMYYITQAIKGRLGRFLAASSAFFLCLYGIEVYQFTVIIDTFEKVFVNLSREWLIIGLLIFTFYIVIGGVKRLANFCSLVMPLFLSGYIFMCMWVIIANFSILPSIFLLIFKSAFTGHAVTGSFLGSTLLLAMQQGASQGVYSSDTAIGFDAVVQSESNVSDPRYQATLAIISTFTDSVICTLTALAILCTGIWTQVGAFYPSEYVAKCLGLYFSNIDYIFVIVIFLAGFTTIQGYFVVGMKSAQYLSRKWGKLIYCIYGLGAYWLFAHYPQQNVLLIMNLSSGFLVLINLTAIIILSRKLDFKFNFLDKNE